MRRDASPYVGARAALATRHGKLPLVALPLWSVLGVTTVQVDADTDALGTFSGEVPRVGSAVATAQRKARLAMEATGLPLGLGSEGSINDPWGLGLGVVDREVVVLVDDERGISVAGRATSTSVVAVATTVAPNEPIEDLLRRANVPPHHLIVCPDGLAPVLPSTGDGQPGAPNPAWQLATTKGIGDVAGLQSAIARAAAASPHGRARVESDLRAHCCPSRRPVIAAAARDLATRLASHCPGCGSPGWGVEGLIAGRDCAWCGGPTDEPVAERWQCPSCPTTEVQPVDGAEAGDPGRCPRCNP